MAVNLHEICRLCLEVIKTPCASLKEGSSLLSKLRKFLPVVKIHPGDGLPMLVCGQCENLVNICYNFKIQVEQSDSALQKYCATQQAHSQFTQLFLRKDEDMPTVDSGSLSMAGSSFQDSIECAVGVHLLAPLGIGCPPTENKLAETFSKSEQEHSSQDEDRGNMRLPSGSEIHSCSCVKSYKSHHYMDMLRGKNHTNEKPYICAYCGQSFRYMSSLSRHLVVHSGEKRYVCHICNKAFTQEAHLKTHSILHTGEKPFLCTVCPMAFSRKGNLKRHLLVHQEKK